MLRRNWLRVARLAGLLFLTACSDETNHYATPANAVYGRVQPPEPGTEIAAWQAEKVAFTIADAEGYFSLTALDAGIYRIVATSPTGYHAEVPEISVGPPEGVSVGTLTMTDAPGLLEWYGPPRHFGPVNGSDLRIELRFTERMDLESFGTNVTLDPPVAGTWGPVPYYANRAYWFVPTQPWRAGTTYAVHLAPGLRTEAGAEWGRTFSFPVVLRPFIVHTVDLAGNVLELPTDDNGTVGVLRFSMPVDPTTLKRGITVDPPLPLTVTVLSDDNPDRIWIQHPEGLPVARDVTITVSDELRDVNGDPLSHPYVVHARTERFRLVDREFLAEPRQLSPNFHGTLFTDTYNAQVNLASAQAAMTVTPPLEVTLERSPYGPLFRTLQFVVRSGLVPGTEYTVRFGPELASTTGGTTGIPQVVHFMTPPVEVTAWTARGITPHGIRDGIGPDDGLELQVRFNATVEAAALAGAVEFQPPMVGEWTDVVTPTGRYNRFVSSQPVSVPPAAEGFAIIRRGISLGAGAGLADDYVIAYDVEPVRVIEGTPVDGGTASRFESVHLTFNATMDPASVESLFSLHTTTGVRVPGRFVWTQSDRHMEFQPTDQLPLGLSYAAVLERGALSASQYALAERWRSVYQVTY